MHLKKLELLGFKSFVDRTDFLFQPGMTGIVGPNGCGKSNVVDAFKWIFGSQSPKGLRGSEMKDVIFNGTLSRKPSGFAEVTVVFENEDRFLDVDYAEVAVTRRLYRSGESEYLINKQKCRLKDIRELFLDTGIGQTSYSILEQGKIDVLLQSSPLDRRVIFEEAAGISKYRIKKAETLRALMRVEDNLSRLQDIIDEVEKRVRRLKSQAARARRYREYSDRLREFRVRVALEDYHSSIESRVDLSFGLYWANHRLSRQEELERRLADALAGRLEKRHELQTKIRDLREKVAGEQSVRERIQERLEQCERRLQELAEEKARKEEDLRETFENLERLRETLAGERRRQDMLARENAGRRERLSELEVRREDRQKAARTRQEELERLKEEIVRLIRSRARVTNTVVQLENELKNLEARAGRLEAELTSARGELASLETRERELSGRLAELAATRDAMEAERTEIVGSAREIESEIERLEGELERRREELHRKSSRYEVLESFEERLDGVASGVAELVRRRSELPETARAHGMVAELVRVDRNHAMAVEAALGSRAQALVVDSQEGALELLDFARREGLGSVEIIVLERVDQSNPEYFPRQGGVLGSLRSVVETADEYEELVDRLLLNVVLVEDLPTAIALSRNGLRPFRLVTLTGEVVEPWGGISLAGEADSGIISRRSEMEELSVEVATLETACGELIERLGSCRGALAACSRSLDEKAGAIEDVKRSIVAAEGEGAQVRREAERLRRQVHVASSELGEVAQARLERTGEKESAEKEGRELDGELSEAESRVGDLESALEEAARDFEEASAAAGEARLELAQGEKEEDGLRELIEERSRALKEREGHIEELRRDLASVAARSERTEEVVRESRAEAEEVGRREGELSRDLEKLERDDEELHGIEKAFRSEMDRIRAGIEELRREREDYHLREQEEKYRRNTILERIDEQYGIDLRHLLERSEERPPEGGDGPPEVESPVEGEHRSPVDSPVAGEVISEEEAALYARYLEPLEGWDRESARSEIKDLQEKLRRLGNVNLEALDELEDLEKRFEFQVAQKDDLVESERNLRGIITEINRKSREMFLDAFGEVQEHFGELFRKCFGGGRAELVLEEGADILDAGIEIVARPPGKKLTSLSLMSGGEKTMTTIALLLAIFRARPSPFCILDEVDAPLDDANVRRFIVLLQEFIHDSQFVIVTHNKLTMAEASTLYGVTMQERGVSKKVAVELETYDPEGLAVAASESES